MALANPSSGATAPPINSQTSASIGHDMYSVPEKALENTTTTPVAESLIQAHPPPPQTAAPTAQQPKRQICFDFTKNQCSRGASCKFSHDLNRIIEVNSEEKGICFDYLKGICSRGLLCRFSHDLTTIQHTFTPQAMSTTTTTTPATTQPWCPATAAICYDFVKNQCSRGAECRYSHDYSTILSSGGTATATTTTSMHSGGGGGRKNAHGSIVCQDFIRGRCSRGTSCKYTHHLKYNTTNNNNFMMGVTSNVAVDGASPCSPTMLMNMNMSGGGSGGFGAWTPSIPTATFGQSVNFLQQSPQAMRNNSSFSSSAAAGVPPPSHQEAAATVALMLQLQQELGFAQYLSSPLRKESSSSDGPALSPQPSSSSSSTPTASTVSHDINNVLHLLLLQQQQQQQQSAYQREILFSMNTSTAAGGGGGGRRATAAPSSRLSPHFVAPAQSPSPFASTQLHNNTIHHHRPWYQQHQDPLTFPLQQQHQFSAYSNLDPLLSLNQLKPSTEACGSGGSNTFVVGGESNNKENYFPFPTGGAATTTTTTTTITTTTNNLRPSFSQLHHGYGSRGIDSLTTKASWGHPSGPLAPSSLSNTGSSTISTAAADVLPLPLQYHHLHSANASSQLDAEDIVKYALTPCDEGGGGGAP